LQKGTGWRHHKPTLLSYEGALKMDLALGAGMACSGPATI